MVVLNLVSHLTLLWQLEFPVMSGLFWSANSKLVAHSHKSKQVCTSMHVHPVVNKTGIHGKHCRAILNNFLRILDFRITNQTELFKTVSVRVSCLGPKSKLYWVVQLKCDNS